MESDVSERVVDAVYEGEEVLTFQPFADRVVVRPERKEEKTTPSGIVIPEQAQQDSQIGEVIAVGPGPREAATHVEMEVEVGDFVVYGRYAGSEIELNGEVLLVLRESDIMGRVE